MKMSRRILTVVVCLALLLSFSGTAFAAASQTFFTTNVYGYWCTGSGRISGTTGKSIFNAEWSSSLVQTIPPAACECDVWVYVYDQSGRLLGAQRNSEGTVSAVAEYTASTSIGKIECSFTFNDVDLGYYTLYNA